jgi:hypothetical protein
MFSSLANLSGLVSSQIYPATDSPRYVKGNAISLGMETVACLGVGAVWVLLKRRNTNKQKLIDEGETENGKLGDQGLDFKYAL